MRDHHRQKTQTADFYHMLGGLHKKAYKNLVMKWHPHDKHSSSKSESEADQNNEGKQEENCTDSYRDHPTPATPGSAKPRHRSASGKFSRSSSSSFLSRSSSRRSHTPTPSLERNASQRSKSVMTQRRSKTPTPSSIEIPTLSKMMSQNGTTPEATPKEFSSLSRSTSRRSTTPIVFSRSTARRKPSQAVEKKLECTLEELCFGTVKKIKITRDVINDVGVIVEEEEVLKIKVKPGWKRGTKITFEGKGDEKPGYLPADIVFLIEEKRHPIFKPVGDDLELGVEVPLIKALTGCTISVPLLGGERKTLKIDEVIHPDYERVIEGQGMPSAKEDGKRGNLRLKFLINFPTELSGRQRNEICSILEGCF
ncbi:hypothetical protein Ancab_002804 [Ancistrocladus abbreviatus]